jgi:hypothetical protein
MSSFEHGEIWWYPEKGAYILGQKPEKREEQKEQREHDER